MKLWSLTETNNSERSSISRSKNNHKYFITKTSIFVLIFGVLTTFQIRNWKITELLDVEEYVSNATLIDAQQNVKREKIKIDEFDDYMSRAPDIEPKKGFRLKTPNGHFAYFFENEVGEPFLLDNGKNLWVWAGVDVKNPIDDWLVRTPEGDVYNFYMNEKGCLKQNFIGNEKDLKVLSNTNLGTIVGFVNDHISDLHYQELPSGSLENIDDSWTGEDNNILPSILEEGFVEFRDKRNISDMETIPNGTKYKELESAIGNSQQNFWIKQDPFLVLSVSSHEQKGTLEMPHKNQTREEKDKIPQNNTLIGLKGLIVNELPND